MLDKTLTPRVRGLYLVGAVLALAVAGFVGWGATRVPRGQDYTQFVVGYAAITAAALVYAAVLFAAVFWRGVITRHTHNRQVGAVVLYVGLVGWLIAADAGKVPEPIGEQVRLLGLVIMAIAAVTGLRHHITDTERNVAEKLLELELRLAEIGEAVARQPRPLQ